MRLGRHAKAARNLEWLADNGGFYTKAKTRWLDLELGLEAGDEVEKQSSKQWSGRELRENDQARLCRSCTSAIDDVAVGRLARTSKNAASA